MAATAGDDVVEDAEVGSDAEFDVVTVGEGTVDGVDATGVDSVVVVVVFAVVVVVEAAVVVVAGTDGAAVTVFLAYVKRRDSGVNIKIY